MQADKSLHPVESQYSREGIYEKILEMLEKSGISQSSVTRKELAGVDEFHVRGVEVSRELAREADLQPGTHVLDVGCGLGGTCRMLAEEFGCKVSGIDITGEYIRTASLLSELTGLESQTNFIQGDATDLPYPDRSFDVVWTQHVQMNVSDKKEFYSQIKRILKRNGLFVYYDILTYNHEQIQYPVPWADNESVSHLVSSDELEQLIQSAGFTAVGRRDQTGKGISFFETVFENWEKGRIPAVSLQILLEEGFSQKLGNLYKNLIEGRLVLESGMYRSN